MKKVRLLVGDDNREFCELVREYMQSQPDFELVGVAHNGLDVVAALEREQPDVVVLDIIMPHLDGIGVLEKLNSMALERVRRSSC